MCFQKHSSLQLDDVIGQAQAVSTSAGEQGRIFDNIGSKLVSVSSKFPMVNGIMNGIRRKKNKVGADIECYLSETIGSSFGLDPRLDWTYVYCTGESIYRPLFMSSSSGAGHARPGWCDYCLHAFPADLLVAKVAAAWRNVKVKACMCKSVRVSP